MGGRSLLGKNLKIFNDWLNYNSINVFEDLDAYML